MDITATIGFLANTAFFVAPFYLACALTLMASGLLNLKFSFAHGVLLILVASGWFAIAMHNWLPEQNRALGVEFYLSTWLVHLFVLIPSTWILWQQETSRAIQTRTLVLAAPAALLVAFFWLLAAI